MRKEIAKLQISVTRFNISKKGLKNSSSPSHHSPFNPPIVRILDKFTELTAELTAELYSQEKQYSFYREGVIGVSTTDEHRINTDLKWVEKRLKL